jgi:hypothetical protein
LATFAFWWGKDVFSWEEYAFDTVLAFAQVVFAGAARENLRRTREESILTMQKHCRIA